jgi:hypothetical protein
MTVRGLKAKSNFRAVLHALHENVNLHFWKAQTRQFTLCALSRVDVWKVQWQFGFHAKVPDTLSTDIPSRKHGQITQGPPEE